MTAHTPRKRFGQNFLHDQNIIANIISVISPQKNQRIIEIGPGKGALTTPLMQHTGKLEVIELDRDLIPRLEEKFSRLGELTIYQEDVLRFDFAQLNATENSLRIVGNLPYNISTPLLFHLMAFLPLIKDMYFMLQKEVVDRICAQPGNKEYGRLSVMLQFYCETESLFVVPPEAFNPAPKVNSAIIRLIPREPSSINTTNKGALSTIVTASFAQRRKTLRNNLKKLLSDEQIKSLDIDPGCRAETLSLDEFKKLSALYLETKTLETKTA